MSEPYGVPPAPTPDPEPVSRRTYIHTGCGKETRLPPGVARRLVQGPPYTSGHCRHCGICPIGEFTWVDGTPVVA